MLSTHTTIAMIVYCCQSMDTSTYCLVPHTFHVHLLFISQIPAIIRITTLIFLSLFLFYFFFLTITPLPPQHSFFFFNDPAPTEISPLPLHAALPIWRRRRPAAKPCWPGCRRMPPSGCSAWQRRRLPARRTPSAIIPGVALPMACAGPGAGVVAKDRESTRLHSNHDQISYSGFFLEKK